MSKPISEIRDKMHQIKKVIDYLKLFKEVNNELIENSKFKMKLKKKGSKFQISSLFIEATKTIERIIEKMK